MSSTAAEPKPLTVTEARQRLHAQREFTRLLHQLGLFIPKIGLLIGQLYDRLDHYSSEELKALDPQIVTYWMDWVSKCNVAVEQYVDCNWFLVGNGLAAEEVEGFKKMLDVVKGYHEELAKVVASISDKLAPAEDGDIAAT